MTIKEFLRAMVEGGRVKVQDIMYHSYFTRVKFGYAFNLSIDGAVMVRPHHMEGCVLVDSGCEANGEDAFRLELP